MIGSGHGYQIVQFRATSLRQTLLNVTVHWCEETIVTAHRFRFQHSIISAAGQWIDVELWHENNALIVCVCVVVVVVWIKLTEKY